jgi:hypothetical protein
MKPVADSLAEDGKAKTNRGIFYGWWIVLANAAI